MVREIRTPVNRRTQLSRDNGEGVGTPTPLPTPFHFWPPKPPLTQYCLARLILLAGWSLRSTDRRSSARPSVELPAVGCGDRVGVRTQASGLQLHVPRFGQLVENGGRDRRPEVRQQSRRSDASRVRDRLLKSLIRVPNITLDMVTEFEHRVGPSSSRVRRGPPDPAVCWTAGSTTLHRLFQTDVWLKDHCVLKSGDSGH